MKITLSILTIIITHVIFAQGPFYEGFYTGYKETLKEKNLDEYSGNADPSKCQQTKGYNPNANNNQELYTDGYRCGVLQASKDIPRFENQLRERTQSRIKEYEKQQNINQTDNVNLERIKNDKILKEKQDFEYQQNIKNAERQKNENIYNQQVMIQMQQKQMQSQQAYRQEISNTLNNLSSSLQAAAYNSIKMELQRRENVASNFIRLNSSKIEKINSIYKQIPPANFQKIINGQFSAHLFLERKYSFINNQELVTEIPCLIMVENNKIINIYPYGKKGFELDYPKNMPSASYLSNGIVKYNNFETLETTTIVLLEPYLSENPKQFRPIDNGTGYISLYTTKSKDEGRTVWIQEIDKNGNIIREISTPLVYAKNEEELSKMSIKSLPFNTGNELNYFGEPVKTPYGTYPFFMKTSKSDTKELKDNENRFVEIKKYRD